MALDRDVEDLRKAMQRAKKAKRRHYPNAIYKVAGSASFGGLLLGYNTGIMNGALLIMEKRRQFHFSEHMTDLIIGCAVFTAAFTSIASGPLADKIGRKPTVMISGLLYIVGGIVLACSVNTWMFIVGRVVIGAGMGISSCIVPVYVSECAPKEMRGFLVNLTQVLITLGYLMAAIFAAILQSFVLGWRIMFGLGAVAGLIQLAFLVQMPESPRFMGMKQQFSRAAETLILIRRAKDDVESEMNEIRASLDGEMMRRHPSRTPKSIWKSTPVKRALFVGLMLQVFQKFTGIDGIIYYSATILRDAGFSATHSLWLSVIPLSVYFVATFPGLWAVEALGRKPLLLFSFFVIAIASCLISTGLYLGDGQSPATLAENDQGSHGVCAEQETCAYCLRRSANKCGYCALNIKDLRKQGSCVRLEFNDTAGKLLVDEYTQDSISATAGKCSRNSKERHHYILMPDVCPNSYAIMPFVGLIVFLAAFGPGAGPVPWTINAEIYPTWARSVANSIAGFTNWMCGAAISSSFLSLFHNRFIPGVGIFYGFMVASLMATIFVSLYVPETKGASLEEIQYIFMDDADRQEYDGVRRSFGLPSVAVDRVSGLLRQTIFVRQSMFPPVEEEEGEEAPHEAKFNL